MKKLILFLNPVEIVIDNKLNNNGINEILSNLPKCVSISKIKVKDPLGFLSLSQMLSDLNHGNDSLSEILDSADKYVLKGFDLVKT